MRYCRLTGSIADQATGLRILAAAIDRGNAMTSGKTNDFVTTALKVSIRTDQKRTSVMLCEHRECGTETTSTVNTGDQDLLPDSARRGLHISRVDLGIRVVRVHQYADQRDSWYKFTQQLQTFRDQRVGELRHAGQVAARPVQRCDQPSVDWIASDDKHDRYCRSCCLCCQCGRIVGRAQRDDRLADEIRRHAGQVIVMPFGPAVFDVDALAFDVPDFRQTFSESSY